MIDLLKNIVNFITSIANYLIHTIQTFLNILSAIPRFTVYIFTLVNNMIPDIFKPFIILSVIIAIVYLIIGRN